MGEATLSVSVEESRGLVESWRGTDKVSESTLFRLILDRLTCESTGELSWQSRSHFDLLVCSVIRESVGLSQLSRIQDVAGALCNVTSGAGVKSEGAVLGFEVHCGTDCVGALVIISPHY